MKKYPPTRLIVAFVSLFALISAFITTASAADQPSPQKPSGTAQPTAAPATGEPKLEWKKDPKLTHPMLVSGADVGNGTLLNFVAYGVGTDSVKMMRMQGYQEATAKQLANWKSHTQVLAEAHIIAKKHFGDGKYTLITVADSNGSKKSSSAAGQ